MENKAMIISSDALDETFEARMSAMKKAMKKEFSIIKKNKDEEIAKKCHWGRFLLTTFR